MTFTYLNDTQCMGIDMNDNIMDNDLVIPWIDAMHGGACHNTVYSTQARAGQGRAENLWASVICMLQR